MTIVEQFRSMSASSRSFYEADEDVHHDCPCHHDLEEYGEEGLPLLSKSSSIYQELMEPPSPSRIAAKFFRSLCAWSLPLILVLAILNVPIGQNVGIACMQPAVAVKITSASNAINYGSLWLLLGFYGNQNIRAGLSNSRLFSVNSMFVKEIIVQNKATEEGPLLYGFLRSPALDNEHYWVDIHNATVPGNYYKEWAYWLNQGSEIQLKYFVKSPDLSLIIAVIEGRDNLDKWHYDNIDSEAALLLQTITGSGEISFEANRDGDYYFALGKPHRDTEVELKMEIHEKLYSVENAVSECSLAGWQACSVKLPFLSSEAALLTTPVKEGDTSHWSLEVIYRSRWQTYLVMIGLVLLAEALLMVRVYQMERSRVTAIESYYESDTAPLMGSSCVGSSIPTYSTDFTNSLSSNKR